MSADDAFYRRFFAALPDACFIFDGRTSRLLEANDAAYRLYGWARETDVEVPAVAGVAELRQPGADVGVPVSSSEARFEWDGRELVAAVTRDVSAQRRFEQELRERQALLNSTFEKSPLLMLISSMPERRHLKVNDAYCRLTGFAREELIGHTSLELGLLDPEEPKKITDELARQRRLDEREVRLLTRSGAPAWLRVWSRVAKTSTGEVLFTIAEDWTARREAERGRAELHERLQKIADRLPGVIFELRRRPDGTLSVPYASPSLEDFFGVKPEDVIHDAAAAFASVHPDDVGEDLIGLERSAIDLGNWQHEHRVIGGDGTVRWMQLDAVPVREADGSVLWRGFVADVTARKANETALRVSRERVQLALEATSDALWDWDLVGHTAFASPQYYTTLGYQPGEFSPGVEGWRERMHPDDLDRVEAATAPCFEGRADRFEVEFRMRAKSGEWRWLLCRGKVIERAASGAAARVVGTNADITERKRLQLNLAQTERLASMGLLAAGVAHEINNPLAYVQANLESLSADLPRLVALVRRGLGALKAKAGDAAVANVLGEATDGFDEVLTSVDSALDGAQRIQKISRGLNTIARAEKSEREAIDVNLAIESAATMAHNEVKSRAALVKELTPLPAVVASEGKLAQVFLNLFVNAAHAIAEGNPSTNEIRVKSWSEGNTVVVEVRDTGRGIEPALLERIFEPFFTTKGAGQGSGLGLSISRSIIAELGGTITAESEVGRGSRVQVRLPARPSLTPRPSRPSPAPRVESKGGRARVLVVDDEAPIRRSLSRVLRHHEVTSVGSGREARALLERGEVYDVILCDLMMPEMTGMELHAWLTEAKPTLAQRVVFLSGGAFTPAAAEYLERVENLRLEKPFHSARLQALISERLEAQRAEPT